MSSRRLRIVCVSSFVAAAFPLRTFAQIPSDSVSHRGDTATVDSTRARHALAPVVIGASRFDRRLQDEPERVEVLSGEDVGEKTVMHPANSVTLLIEMPGVRAQTTSDLGGAGLRLQGLRGRYTLLLADGLPLYGSSSEGLGFLQIPPLDLAQVEVIKGAATALYGPSAAGGVLNLISRRPPTSGRADRDVLLNLTSTKGADGLLWNADNLSNTLGYTVIAGAHNQQAVDIDGDDWTDVPAFRRVEIRPRIFWRNNQGSSAVLTVGAADEQRHAGFIRTSPQISGSNFRITADTRRADAGAITHLVNQKGQVLSIRSSLDQQWQDRRYGDSTESDRRGTFFTEVTLATTLAKSQRLIGAAVQWDGLSSDKLRDARYSFLSESLFGQETFLPNDRFSVTATARADHNNRYGTFLSPRVSALFRVATGWAARASAGSGVFVPTPFIEEADAIGLSRVRGFNGLRAERIAQASGDLTRTMGPVEITGTLFRSTLAHAVVAREDSASGTLWLINAPIATRTSGASLYAVYDREPIVLSATYGYTRAREWSPRAERLVEVDLTPRHSGGLDLAAESDETKTRAGVEIFYTGRQSLEDNPYRRVGAPYTTLGILVEQGIGRATLFANGENLLNVRQTHFDPLLLPRESPLGRWTTPQWAPLDGRTFNAGLRMSF